MTEKRKLVQKHMSMLCFSGSLELDALPRAESECPFLFVDIVDFRYSLFFFNLSRRLLQGTTLTHGVSIESGQSMTVRISVCGVILYMALLYT